VSLKPLIVGDGYNVSPTSKVEVYCNTGFFKIKANYGDLS